MEGNYETESQSCRAHVHIKKKNNRNQSSTLSSVVATAAFFFFFKETKQTKLNSSINEYVLTLVKRIVTTSPQLFTLALFNLLHRLKHPE